MDIYGIAANYYQMVYRNNKAAKAETGNSFAEIASRKVAEAEKEILSEKTSSIDLFGTNAPDEVKQAWMEAEEETGMHIAKAGLYITPDGKHAWFTQLAGPIACKWMRGELNETDQVDLLGSSVESAINAVNKWLYDLDHPLAGQPARSTEDQKYVAMERAFYVAFLEKLKNLSGQEAAAGKNEAGSLAEIIGTAGSQYYKTTGITREAVSAAYEKNFVEA
ncbi:MAG: hypothetical protein NC389_09015 [Acetatifactor muris]|nr:hypothetical protein [Acetatifactor muris]